MNEITGVFSLFKLNKLCLYESFLMFCHYSFCGSPTEVRYTQFFTRFIIHDLLEMVVVKRIFVNQISDLLGII